MNMLHTLRQGKKRLSGEAQKRIASFTLSQLTENGAFIDKNGNEDLYYTSFGLMLALIFKLDINISATLKWIDKQEKTLSGLVGYAACFRSRMLCTLLTTNKLKVAVTRFFTKQPVLPDFANYPHGDKNSPYSQYILLSLKEDLGIKTSNSQEIRAALSPYRIETGGYANIRGSRQPTTNATVAALAIKGQSGGYIADDEVMFLRSLQDESGGFLADVSASVPDLLSTATALFMLKCYGVAPRIDASDFIDAHWAASGGFYATLLDESCDVEYTFYGLLALGAAV